MIRRYKTTVYILIPLLLAIVLLTGNKLYYYDQQIISTRPTLPFKVNVWRDMHLGGVPSFIIADNEGMMLAGERHAIGNTKMDVITKYGIAAKYIIVPFTDTAGRALTALTDGRTIWLDNTNASATGANVVWKDIHETPMGLYRFHTFCFVLMLLVLFTYPLITHFAKLKARKEAGLD